MNREHAVQDVLLAFGSNLGNRQKTLELAWFDVARSEGIETLRISRFYETMAVGGPPGQPDFLNAVGLIRTDLDPEKLLDRLQEIELQHGRVRKEHWGPRTLDIDILLYGDEIIETERLCIPHREMLHRDFVLRPAMEIVPEMIHPISGRSIAEHARERLS